LVSNNITIADIAIAAIVFNLFRVAIEKNFVDKQLKNLNKWFEGIASNASFKKYFGRLFYCSKEWEVVSIEPQEKKVEEVKKEEHVKAAKKPKKKSEDDEDENPIPKPEKNPLDSLPPSKFILYDFKTLFVNAVNKQEACDFLF